MIENVRARYPAVYSALSRIPPPRVRRATLLWAILAGAGASFFVGTILTMFLAIVLRAFGSYPAPWASGLTTAVAIAVALGVAYVSGGRHATTVYVGYIAIERILSLGSQLRFCGTELPAPPSCSLLGYVLSLWPYVLGGLLGYALGHWMLVAEGDGNRLLEVAGALALTQAVLLTIVRFLFPFSTGLEASLLQLLVAVIAGVACGRTLMRRVEAAAQWKTLVYVGIVGLGEWLLVTLPAYIEQVGVGGKLSIATVGLVAFMFPFLTIGTAALLLYMAEARKVTAAAS